MFDRDRQEGGVGTRPSSKENGNMVTRIIVHADNSSAERSIGLFSRRVEHVERQ